MILLVSFPKDGTTPHEENMPADRFGFIDGHWTSIGGRGWEAPCGPQFASQKL